MWNIKCVIIPVTIGATGSVTKGLKKDLEAIPGDRSIDSLQKTAVLETAHIIWKLEDWAVGIGIGSRGEVPGEKGCDRRNNNNNNNKLKTKKRKHAH